MLSNLNLSIILRFSLYDSVPVQERREIIESTYILNLVAARIHKKFKILEIFIIFFHLN